MDLDITIAICAYNAASRLAGPLKALAAQNAEGIGWEVLVIDNKSADQTSALAQELGKQLKLPLRVIHENESGLNKARRRAAIEARGQIVSYVDDDNLVDPDWLRQCVVFFQSHPRCGIAGGKISPIFEDLVSKPADFQEKFAMALAIRDFGDQPRQLTPPADDPPCGAGMTGRTELFRLVLGHIGVNLPDRKGALLLSGGDTEIGLLIHKLGWEAWYTPTLRMGHVLPASRLTEAYLDRLIAVGSRSGPWLDYLRGKEARMSKAGYLSQYLLWRLRSLRMLVVRLVRRKSHPHWHRYGPWAAQFKGRATGYWNLAMNNPAGKLEQVLAQQAQAVGIQRSPALAR